MAASRSCAFSCSVGAVGRPAFTAAISWLMQKISTSLSWMVASPFTEGVTSIIASPCA